MKYHSLYRKWRPQTFEDIIGQKHITQTLINAISLDRVSHAYVFSGPRGVGKTTTARILAKSLNCEKGPTIFPCNECVNCLKITSGHSMDVIEIDGASNRGIDDVRELRNKIKFVPTEGKYKIYIIDEVHMLTTEAFNALLKTLEEPPPHVIFVFATTAPQKIPDTILSRCQWFNFKRIPLRKIIQKLESISNDENLNIEKKVLNIIAKTATGSMRDAESTLDQIISYCGKEIKAKNAIEILGITDEEVFYALLDAIAKNEISRAIEMIHQSSDFGGDPIRFMRNLTEYVHNLLLLKTCDVQTLSVKDIFIDENEKLLRQSNLINKDTLFKMMTFLIEIDEKMKYSYHPWLLLEMFIFNFTSKEKRQIKKIEKQHLDKDAKTHQENIKNEPSIKKLVDLKEDKISEKNISLMSEDSNFMNIWPKVLNKIKKDRMSLYSFISFNNSIDCEGDKIIIGFNKKHAFHKEILEKKSNISLLQDFIKEEIGIPVIIECVLNENSASHSREKTNTENNLNSNHCPEKKEDLIAENNKEINQADDRSIHKDSILQESLNIFMGKIIDE